MANRSLALLLTISTTLLWAPYVSAEIRFGIAAEPYAPFTSKDANGGWVGWEIDLMNAVCRHMKEECSIVESSWDGIIPALNAHYLDVIWASMAITDDRSKVIDFPDPYYTTPTVLIGERNGDLEFSPAHLKDKEIGVQGGTIHLKTFEKYYRGSTLKIYQTQDEALQDLTARRIDYVIGDLVPLLNFLDTSVGTLCCEMKGQTPNNSEIAGAGAAAGVRRGDVELKEKLNSALKGVQQSGEYEQISKKYFPLSLLRNRLAVSTGPGRSATLANLCPSRTSSAG